MLRNAFNAVSRNGPAMLFGGLALMIGTALTAPWLAPVLTASVMSYIAPAAIGTGAVLSGTHGAVNLTRGAANLVRNTLNFNLFKPQSQPQRQMQPQMQ
jgi:hypothetical protein